MSLVSPEDRPLLSAIEKLLKEKINLIVPAQYAGPQPEDLAEDDRREEQNHHQRLSQQSRARRRPAAAPRRSREEASESSEVSAEDSRSDRDSSAPERRGAARRHQVKRSTSRRSPEASSRRGSSDRSDRGDRAERSDRFDPDNFGNSINYTPRRKAPGRSRSRDTIARYEPVDPFAPEHQALFLPQSMPGERPYRAGGAEKRRRPSRGPRSDRSTDYFERNSRYTDSNTRSNLPPGLAPRRGGRSRNR